MMQPTNWHGRRISLVVVAIVFIDTRAQKFNLPMYSLATQGLKSPRFKPLPRHPVVEVSSSLPSSSCCLYQHHATERANCTSETTNKHRRAQVCGFKLTQIKKLQTYAKQISTTVNSKSYTNILNILCYISSM